MATREELITDNLGLVRACVNRFVGRGIDYDDLYQIGCIGLIKAADGFDSSRGLMFSTYAVPTILGELKRVFRDGGMIKVSRSLKQIAINANKAKQQLEHKYSREVKVSEIAEHLGLPLETVNEALSILQPAVSLTVQDDDGTRELIIPDTKNENEIFNRLYIDELMKNLTEDEKQLISLRYYMGKTQSETARIMDMTQVQVSRAEKKILTKMRTAG